MLIIGVLVMYQTKAFWGLEHNPNANTLNNTMNFASSYNIMPIILIAIAVIGSILVITSTRGFG
jgi:hypothetical protein